VYRPVDHIDLVCTCCFFLAQYEETYTQTPDIDRVAGEVGGRLPLNAPSGALFLLSKWQKLWKIAVVHKFKEGRHY
jgi:hypothetical protein